jgi:hypothetical protein
MKLDLYETQEGRVSLKARATRPVAEADLNPHDADPQSNAEKRGG